MPDRATSPSLDGRPYIHDQITCLTVQETVIGRVAVTGLTSDRLVKGTVAIDVDLADARLEDEAAVDDREERIGAGGDK